MVQGISGIYSSNVAGETYTNANKVAEKLGMTQNELFEKVITLHKVIANALGVDSDYVKEKVLNIIPNISQYYKFIAHQAKNSILYQKDGIYKETTKWECGCRRVEKQFYDVYVTEDSYIYLKGEAVVREILEEKYTNIFRNEKFFVTEKRFKCNSIFTVTKETKLCELSNILLTNSDNGIDYLDYTVADLIDVLAKPNYPKIKKKSLFNIYCDCYSGVSLFLTLDEDKHISLSIPLNALKNTDWSLIEEKVVYNIPCYPKEEKRWFNGKQNEAPYFSHPLVVELKKCLLNN